MRYVSIADNLQLKSLIMPGMVGNAQKYGEGGVSVSAPVTGGVLPRGGHVTAFCAMADEAGDAAEVKEPAQPVLGTRFSGWRLSHCSQQSLDFCRVPEVRSVQSDQFMTLAELAVDDV